MSKKAVFGIIILNLIITFVAVLLLAGYASAKLSTIPWLSKFDIFNPQSPIVINRREEVRISDSTDVPEAVGKIQSRLSLLVKVDDGVVTPVANLINLTSDGYFLTAKNALATNQSYLVIAADGRTAVVTQVASDPASGVGLVKASLTDMAVAPFADSVGLVTGQKVILAHSTFAEFGVGAQASVVTNRERDAFGTNFRSDYRSRSFGVQGVGALSLGEAVSNLNGEIVGLWDGASVVPTSVLNRVQQLFFENKKTINRPAFGFEYRMLSNAEASALKVASGAKVTAVADGSVAKGAGMLVGDIITRVGGEDVTEQHLLEEILDGLKVGDIVPFVAQRAGKEQAFSIKPVDLR